MDDGLKGACADSDTALFVIFAENSGVRHAGRVWGNGGGGGRRRKANQGELKLHSHTVSLPP